MNCKCTNVYTITIITISLFLVMINIKHNNIDSFCAQAATIPDFNFGSAGDWGCNSNTDATVNSIFNKNPELVLGLGDYSYQSTANCWLSAVNPIDEKMNITIGNHENSASSEDLNTYLNHFGMNSQYYSFNIENVHFLSMATELSYSSGSSQNLFVKNDLASAAVIQLLIGLLFISINRCIPLQIVVLLVVVNPLFEIYIIQFLTNMELT